MAFSTGPGALRLINGPAPVNARRIDATEYDFNIAAHMDRIHAWAGAWQQDLDAVPLQSRAWINGAESRVAAADTQISYDTLAGNRAWLFPDVGTSSVVASALTVPASYTIYCAFSIGTSDASGLFGHMDGAGARIMFRANSTNGALRLDHGAVTADILETTGLFSQSSVTIAWASFDAATLLASLGGTASGVAAITADSTKTLASQHKGGAGFDIGNSTAFAAEHRIGEVIIASGALPSLDSEAHADIVTNLAEKYGLTAA